MYPNECPGYDTKQSDGEVSAKYSSNHTTNICRLNILAHIWLIGLKSDSFQEK